MKSLKNSIIVIALLLPGIIGCATLQSWFSNSAVQAGIQVAIDVGVGLVLANNPSEAGALQTAATALASVAVGSGTTITTFEAAADAKINAMSSLNAPEKLALEQIVTLAATALTAGTSALPAATAIDLATVFTDIANAASVYSIASPKAAKMGLRR